jgi:uncharacterized protein YggE
MKFFSAHLAPVPKETARHIVTRTAAPSRPSLRPFLTGAVVVALAIAGLALLSEAFASGGQPVYLARIEPGGQSAPVKPSLVVTGAGRATAPAERGAVQLLLVRAEPYSRDFAAGGAAAPPAPGSGSLAPVIDAILGLGITEQAIRTVSSPSLISVCGNSARCSAVRVDVTVERPDRNVLNDIVDAAGEAAATQALTVQDVGAGYSIADCSPLREQAREAAVADAQARADAQVSVLGIRLGKLIEVSEAAPTEPVDAAGCAAVHGTTSDAWWTPVRPGWRFHRSTLMRTRS